MKDKLKIIDVNIYDIKPYENNPRDNEKAVEYVANSIENFGFKVPIIINCKNVIIAGHTRYKAALKLNMSTVPCIVASDLTEEQERAFRIADNKVAERSSWNDDLLREELKLLDELDMSSLGFEDWELEQLLNPLSSDDIEDFFVQKEQKEKEPKKIICPLCGGEFEQ